MLKYTIILKIGHNKVGGKVLVDQQNLSDAPSERLLFQMIIQKRIFDNWTSS